MLTISKSKFKAHALQILRELEAGGEEVIITDRNRPIARLLPFAAKRPVDDVFKDWRGKVKFHEDPNAPTIGEWSDA
jgi:prevent-host-death family protein